MNRSPRYCFCEAGQPPWAARADDRFCGLCGRELLAALPLAPVLTPGPPTVLAAYLSLNLAPAPAWSGPLTIRLVGLDAETPTLRWKPLTTPPLELTGRALVRPATLALCLSVAPGARDPSGPLARARLTIMFHGRSFPFEVCAFAVPADGCSAWLTGQPGRRPDGPVMVVYRDARRATAYLELDAGPGVPVQWESIRCDHPAASVTVLHPEQAQAPARARVRWDPGLLRGGEADDEAVFHLRPLALPAVTLRQRVRWRLRQPFRCQPAALAVDHLDEDHPETHLVRVTNEEPESLSLMAVEPQASWVASGVPAGGLPLRLAPGASTVLPLNLVPQEFAGTAGPHATAVGLVIDGRGHQDYPVRVEAVRGPHRLDGPLLLDPGPPRVVLAWWDAPGRRLVYLPSCGDGGLPPEEFGVSTSDYGEAVCGRRPAHTVLRYLIAAALTRCRMRDRLAVGAVRVCRHPWVPADFEFLGAELCGWDGPLPGLSAADGAGGAVPFRLDAWDGWVGEGPGRPPAPLLRPAERLHSLGAGLLRWLARRFAKALLGCGAPVPEALPAMGGGAEPPADFLWMRLACEALLLDYRWGPAHAWRRLLSACHARLAAVRDPFSLKDAHRQAARRAADYAQQLCMALVRHGSAGRLVLVGPLFRGRLLRGVLRSILTSAGFETACVAAPWVALLVPPAEEPDG